MSRQKKATLSLRRRLEYLGVRLLAVVLRILPLPAAAALGRGLAACFCRLDARHRRRVMDQMRDAFGGALPEVETASLTREMYRHFGTMLAEFVRLPSLTAENIDRYMDWTGVEETLRPVLDEGKGVIFATGHIGNWEFCGIAYTLKGYTGGAVARPLDNPLLDDYVRGIRTGSGQQIWDKSGALRKVVRILRNRGGFGILVDQDAGKRGTFVPFFGIEASTISTPADLAMLWGTPIIVAAAHRVGGPMRFKAKFRPPIRPDLSAEKEAERRRLLARINEDLESIIREEPSQWLWLHRRWKTRPRAAKPRPH